MNRRSFFSKLCAFTPAALLQRTPQTRHYTDAELLAAVNPRTGYVEVPVMPDTAVLVGNEWQVVVKSVAWRMFCPDYAYSSYRVRLI